MSSRVERKRDVNKTSVRANKLHDCGRKWRGRCCREVFACTTTVAIEIDGSMEVT